MNVMRFSAVTTATLVTWLASEPASARFQTEDADEIDPEEHYNTETYNDKLSYRYPLSFDEAWAAHDVGFRANAGSLNVRRFDYHEDVKFKVNPDWQEGPFGFAFEQSRREDVLEARRSREIRMNWLVADHLTLGLLGDGASYKEQGDVGVALGLWSARENQAEVYYWSVDHYYETKRAEADDWRPRRPRTFGARGISGLPSTKVAWRYEWDAPMEWHRASQDYDYEMSRSEGSVRVEHGELTDLRYVAQVDAERKSEARRSLSGPEDKALVRHSEIYEVGLQRRTPERKDQSVGLVHIERLALYDEAGPDTSPPMSSRAEIAAYLTEMRPAGGRHFVQNGMHVNDVRIREKGETRHETEVKYQAAYAYALKETLQVFLNTTWDLDQLGRDFPYGKRAPFRPWGGGDIQFVAVF